MLDRVRQRLEQILASEQSLQPPQEITDKITSILEAAEVREGT